MIKAAIVGATGYAAAELLRLLSAHPEVEVTHLISDSTAGAPITNIYPSMHGFCPLVMESMDGEKLGKECDVVFLALPHGVSAASAPALLAGGAKVIDLSADFRYTDLNTYEAIYGVTHPCPDLLAEAVYGLSEIYPEQISAARLVGNPGCYTTCANLPLIPAVRAGLIDPATIIIDSASGVTGAGRKPAQAYHYPETNENYMAYKVASHRHTSEIEQEVSAAAGKAVRLTFTPHLLPVNRGILSTIYAQATDKFSVEAMYEAYSCYADQPFVYVHEQGSLPQLKMVVGSNMVHIGFVYEKATNRVILLSALDNLVKGAAGQAIQNMNLMFGLDQSTGLATPPWYL